LNGCTENKGKKLNRVYIVVAFFCRFIATSGDGGDSGEPDRSARQRHNELDREQ